MYHLQVRAQQPSQDCLWHVRHRLSDFNQEVNQQQETEHRTRRRNGEALFIQDPIWIVFWINFGSFTITPSR